MLPFGQLPSSAHLMTKQPVSLCAEALTVIARMPEVSRFMLHSPVCRPALTTLLGLSVVIVLLLLQRLYKRLLCGYSRRFRSPCSQTKVCCCTSKQHYPTMKCGQGGDTQGRHSLTCACCRGIGYHRRANSNQDGLCSLHHAERYSKDAQGVVTAVSFFNAAEHAAHLTCYPPY